MPQPDVAQAHVPQRFQLGFDPGEIEEKLQSLIDGHAQDIGDTPVPHGDFQSFPVVAPALADLAGNRDVGQELHLDLIVALPLAGLTPAALDVEGEPAGRITPHPSLGQAGEQLSDGGEGAGVGGRVGAGGAADGRLVDIDHLVDVLHTHQFIVCARQVSATVHDLRQFLVKDLVGQGALSRPRNPGDADQHPQRQLYVDVLEVVLSSALDGQGFAVALAALRRHRYDFSSAEVLAGYRLGDLDHLFQRSGGHHVAALLPGTRTHVRDVIGGPHHRLIVLHHDHRVSHVLQLGQRVDEEMVVVGMQANRRLIANVEHPGESRADLGSQTDPLGFTTRQGPRRAAHGDVVQAYVFQELQPAFNLLENLIADGFLARGKGLARVFPWRVGVDLPHPCQRLAHVFVTNIHDPQAADLDRQGFRPQALAVAGPAGARRHVPLDLLTRVVGFGLPVTAGQVGDHSLIGGFPAIGLASMGLVLYLDLLGIVAIEYQVQMFLG